MEKAPNNIEIDKLRVMAEQGDPFAQYNLGNCYLDGEGVEKDMEKALSLFKKSAEQGNGEAQNLLKSLISHNTYIEEEIYFEEYGNLKYYLSNDIKTLMEIDLMDRMKISGLDIDLRGGLVEGVGDNIKWIENTGLSEKVKEVMNRNNVNYSMTEYKKGEKLVKVINKRIKGKWYYYSFIKK